jgi:hypothetical protein
MQKTHANLVITIYQDEKTKGPPSARSIKDQTIEYRHNVPTSLPRLRSP